jgi:hypothetical protein
VGEGQIVQESQRFVECENNRDNREFSSEGESGRNPNTDARIGRSSEASIRVNRSRRIIASNPMN